VIEVEGFKKVAGEPGRCGERGDDVAAAFRAAGAGEIQGDDVEAVAEGLHHGNHGGGATHEAVEKDKRGLAGAWSSPFEVGELNAVDG